MSNKIDKALEVAKRDFNDAGGFDALVQDILNLSKEAATYDPEDITEYGCDEPTLDIRLGYEPEWSDRSYYIPRGFHVMTGCSDYDQIHYSACGASSVGVDETEESARGIAEDLLDQVLDMVADMTWSKSDDWDPDAEESDEEE